MLRWRTRRTRSSCSTRLLEVAAPFNPEGACFQVAALLGSYHLNATMGDDHAEGWVLAALGRHGVIFTSRPPAMTRWALYSETLPKFSSYQVRLLDHRKLISQYAALERRLLPSGIERIDHPNRSGHHDDLANACAGALWRCETERRIVISPEFLNARCRCGRRARSRRQSGAQHDVLSMMRGRSFG